MSFSLSGMAHWKPLILHLVTGIFSHNNMHKQHSSITRQRELTLHWHVLTEIPVSVM